MREPVAAAVVVLASVAAHAGDESGRASVEVTAERAVVYAGEPVRLNIDVTYDSEFFAQKAVPLFSRKTDVPLHVQAPWLRGIAGMEPIPNHGTRRPVETVALGDDVVRAWVSGFATSKTSSKTSLRVTRGFIAREPGEIVLDGPELRFAYATKFEEDFLDGRRGVDRHDVVVRGKPLTLRVLAVPTEGRPASFGGAVGRLFSIQADVTRREVMSGETFRVTLRMQGTGHLANFDAPRLDGLAGFHVYGVLDDHGRSVRTIAYDVAALDASVREIPPIEWSCFDTRDPPSFRTLRTTPIPITVQATADSKTAAPLPPPEGDTSTWIWAALAVAVGAFIAAVAWIATRRGGREAPDPAQARRAAAAVAVRTAATSGRDAGAEFTEYLAARLGCAPAAVVGADLASRLASAGVPDAMARRAASAHDALIASRYGGSGAPTATELAALTAEIESAPDALAG